MSELLVPPALSEITAPSWEELLHLNAVRLAIASRTDLADVVDFHAAHFVPKPPVAFGNDLLHKEGEINTVTGRIYRKLGSKAIKDLAKSGVVRNELTARAINPLRGSHTVHWIKGIDGGHINTGPYAVIETMTEEAHRGWVTVDRLTAIFFKMPNGLIENILSKP